MLFEPLFNLPAFQDFQELIRVTRETLLTMSISKREREREVTILESSYYSPKVILYLIFLLLLLFFNIKITSIVSFFSNSYNGFFIKNK